MSCLISWGVMIQWNASSQTHFELPSYINRYIISQFIIRNVLAAGLDNNLAQSTLNKMDE